MRGRWQMQSRTKVRCRSAGGGNLYLQCTRGDTLRPTCHGRNAIKIPAVAKLVLPKRLKDLLRSLSGTYQAKLYTGPAQLGAIQALGIEVRPIDTRMLRSSMPPRYSHNLSMAG